MMAERASGSWFEAMGLKDLDLSDEYRSDEGSLVERLWNPCLGVSVEYDRAVGYFTSGGLAAAATGLESFLDRGGRMRLVASPLFQPEDLESIKAGLRAQDDVVATALLRTLTHVDDSTETSRLALLSWLIAANRLEIRIAVSDGSGIYHEKVALFRDAAGDAVAATGSPNETAGGLVSNFEAVDVYTSWSSSRDRLLRKQSHFSRLWADETPGLRIVPMPTAVAHRLVEVAPPREANATSRHSTSTAVAAGSQPRLRDYQRAAVDAWVRAEYSGVMALATGTGKTITSLAAARELVDKRRDPTVLVILAPLIHLVRQWAEETRRWGFRAIECFGSSSSWKPRALEAIDYLRAGALDEVCLVSTHATAALPHFVSLLERVKGEQMVLVADEVHHLGTGKKINALAPHARHRLGLSATPERWDDAEGTALLFNYFGPVVYEFGIREAIESNVLCPYEYRPTVVQLEPDELEEYEAVANALEAQLRKRPEKRNYSRIRRLLRERSAVLNSARGKLAVLQTVLGDDMPRHTLIYCANRRQLAAVMDLLWDRGIASRQFTGEEDPQTRSELLRDFTDGRAPVLVAIRCLDEGVDIPEARIAHLLASSGNPLQFVQRRGRLLRRAEGKTKSLIHDLVVVPDDRTPDVGGTLERELRRVVDFADVALNRTEAVDAVWQTLKERGLLHLLGGD
jgi:superfamily II DNA or RNA helicase